MPRILLYFFLLETTGLLISSIWLYKEYKVFTQPCPVCAVVDCFQYKHLSKQGRIKMFSHSRIKKTRLRAEKSDSNWLWDPPGINLGGYRWLGSCTIEQRSPTPQPWSVACYKSSHVAGGEWQVSEQSFICIPSCSPSLALPPELRFLSDQQ